MNMSVVRENIDFCLKRIQGACVRAGRPVRDVTLVVVTKEVELPDICEALDCGIVHIGESRVQEALLKYGAINQYAKDKGHRIVWHMIGHLQTNKVKEAVGLFDLIHSLDSIRLARQVDCEAKKISKVQDVLIQINISGESAKFGFPRDSIDEVLKQMRDFKNLNVKGFMTIAPLADEIETSRACFHKLKELKDKLAGGGFYVLPVLSMGMTHDFEAAIEEGATIVRIGTAIFGGRNR